MLKQTSEECIEVEDQSLRRITHELRKRGLVTIDKREQGGRLWVIGGQELQATLTHCKKMDFSLVLHQMEVNQQITYQHGI